VEESLEGARPTNGRETQQGGANFLSTTNAGRRVPSPAEGTHQVRCRSGGSGSRENEKRKRRVEAEELAPRLWNPCFSPRLPSWHQEEE